jgi:hypothetical protein
MTDVSGSDVERGFQSGSRFHFENVLEEHRCFFVGKVSAISFFQGIEDLIVGIPTGDTRGSIEQPLKATM